MSDLDKLRTRVAELERANATYSAHFAHETKGKDASRILTEVRRALAVIHGHSNGGRLRQR